MFQEIRIQNFTADEICDLLLQDDNEITEILALAVRQLIQEMAGVDAQPTAAEVLSQLAKVA